MHHLQGTLGTCTQKSIWPFLYHNSMIFVFCQSLMLSELHLISVNASRGEISSNVFTDPWRDSKAMGEKLWIYLKNEDKFLFWWCYEMFCSWLHLPLNLHSLYSVKKMELQFITTFICFSSNFLGFAHQRKLFNYIVRIHLIAFWLEIHFLAWKTS